MLQLAWFVFLVAGEAMHSHVVDPCKLVDELLMAFGTCVVGPHTSSLKLLGHCQHYLTDVGAIDGSGHVAIGLIIRQTRGGAPKDIGELVVGRCHNQLLGLISADDVIRRPAEAGFDLSC